MCTGSKSAWIRSAVNICARNNSAGIRCVREASVLESGLQGIHVHCVGNNKAGIKRAGNKADIRSASNMSLWNSSAYGSGAHAGNKHICAQNTRGWENERVFLKHECEEHVCRMEYE
jgi:hypothetical protein